jgi:hypothetical protein
MRNTVFRVVFFSLTLLIWNTISAQTDSDASATGISRAFNPAISVNALFSGMASDNENLLWSESGTAQGLHCQAADIEITSNVDIYLQSKIVLGGGEDEALGVEEAYLTTLRMPIPVILRGGMMLNSFGRYNLYHIHHMAFAENPLILNQIFGPKLREVGLEASYLLPIPWYSDLLVGVLNGNNEFLFNSDKQADLAYLAHFDNFWDLSDETTWRMGCSVVTGNKGLSYANDATFDSTISKISSLTWGVDFHLKWKPFQYGRYRSFILEGEYVNSTLNIDDKRTQPLHGYYVQGLYQFGLRWWIQTRFEQFNRAKSLHNFFNSPDGIEIDPLKDFSGNRFSFAIAYVPTEFSAYRLQYNRLKLADSDEQQIVLQVNVTIGSHPAHKY